MDKTYIQDGIDKGKEPFVMDIEKETKDNENFRTTLWTGEKLQLTVMCIQPGDDIGMEVHPETDQFLRIEEGEGMCQMGDKEGEITHEKKIEGDFAIFVPANTWHNVVNTGDKPLKLYTIYAGPDHVAGTVHPTHEDAEKDPNEDHH